MSQERTLSLITTEHHEMYTECGLEREADPMCLEQAWVLFKDEFMTVTWY